MENIDFEVQTLLQPSGYERDSIKGTLTFDHDFPVVEDVDIESVWPDVWTQPRSFRRRHSSAPSKDTAADAVSWKLACRIKSTNNLFYRDCTFHGKFNDIESGSSRSNSESEKTDEDAEEITTIKCSTFGTEYAVKGLRYGEMPVVGTFIDPRIMTGFRYYVRQLGSDNYFFNRNALCLLSIGLGYGKRMTFEGSTRNYNPNFFWSDSIPEGFGFSIQAVATGDKFAAVTDAGRPAAELTVQGIIDQIELSQEINNGAILKTIKVTLVCDVVNMADAHGVMPLRRNSTDTVIDVMAVLEKPKGAREATLKEITALDVPFIGSCILHPMSL